MKYIKSFNESKIENVHYLIPGKKYRIEHPVYDDFEEGLEPEISIVEVVKKNRHGFLLKN